MKSSRNYDPGPRMFGPVCRPCGRETRRVFTKWGSDAFECLDCGWQCPAWYEDAAEAFAVINAARGYLALQRRRAS